MQEGGSFAYRDVDKEREQDAEALASWRFKTIVKADGTRPARSHRRRGGNDE
jgi:hypothetical protein